MRKSKMDGIEVFPELTEAIINHKGLFLQFVTQHLEKIQKLKKSGAGKSKIVAKEMEGWAKKNGWPAPDGNTFAEFFLHKFNTSENGEWTANKPDIHLLYKEYKEYIDKKMKGEKEKPELVVSNPIELIKEDFRNVVLEFEKSLTGLIPLWKKDNENKGLKVSCATFCIYLFEKGYFIENSLIAVKKFANSRYGNKYATRINKLRKKANEAKYQNEKQELIRILYKKHYGTI